MDLVTGPGSVTGENGLDTTGDLHTGTKKDVRDRPLSSPSLDINV